MTHHREKRGHLKKGGHQCITGIHHSHMMGGSIVQPSVWVGSCWGINWPVEIHLGHWKFCNTCAREWFLQLPGHMEIFAGANLKSISKTRIGEIGEAKKLTGETIALRIASNILLLLNILRMFTLWHFQGQYFSLLFFPSWTVRIIGHVSFHTIHNQIQLH